jgi:hypothetical protein
MSKQELSPIEMLHEDIQEMKRDIKSLIHFRGWVLGAACVAGAVGGILVRLI